MLVTILGIMELLAVGRNWEVNEQKHKYAVIVDRNVVK